MNKRVAFLDDNFNFENGSITTNLHTKGKDCNHCSFSYPYHTKKTIIYSQTLRLSNICTSKEDFGEGIHETDDWFKNGKS